LNPSLQCFASLFFGESSIVKIDIKISFFVSKTGCESVTFRNQIHFYRYPKIEFIAFPDGINTKLLYSKMVSAPT